MKVKDFISFIQDYPDSEINFYICDDEDDKGVKVDCGLATAVCTPEECKVFLPYNFLEGIM